MLAWLSEKTDPPSRMNTGETCTCTPWRLRRLRTKLKAVTVHGRGAQLKALLRWHLPCGGKLRRRSFRRRQRPGRRVVGGANPSPEYLRVGVDWQAGGSSGPAGGAGGVCQTRRGVARGRRLRGRVAAVRRDGHAPDGQRVGGGQVLERCCQLLGLEALEGIVELGLRRAKAGQGGGGGASTPGTGRN
jgi:hypothetical protein